MILILFLSVFDTVGYYADVVSDVLDKRSAGFDTSITDLWARALSYHLFDQNTYPDHAATTSFGVAIRNTSSFRNHQMPYPIVIALEREPGQLIVGQNASIFSFDPYEFGSFEPLGGGALGGTRGAFVPIDYLGTRWDDGKIGDNQCTTGFECVHSLVSH
jgi:lysophospholipase